MPRYDAYAIFRTTFDEFTHYLAYLCLFLISNPKFIPKAHKGLNKVYVIIPYMVLFRGTCNHVIYTTVDEVKNMASSYEYDSDLDRVYGILNDISKSEFSGFESEVVSSSSDEEIDENPVD